MKKEPEHLSDTHKSRRKPGLWIALGIILLLLAALGLAANHIWNLLEGFRVPSVSPAPVTTPAPEETPAPSPEPIPSPTPEPDLQEEPDTTAEPADAVVQERDESIYIYVLYGADTRDPLYDLDGNTDTVILLILDMKHQKLKLISIMRDTLMDVPGWTDDMKVTALVPRTGVDKAISVLETTFGIPIDGYAAVTFSGAAQLIDIVGGVDVEIADAQELGHLNGNLSELCQEVGGDPADYPPVADFGLQRLNGQQALAYMRIRHYGHGDYQRTERQRAVLISAFRGVSDASLGQMYKMLIQMQGYVSTNLSVPDMIRAATRVYKLRGCETETLRIPLDGAHYMGKYNGSSVLIMSVKKNAAAVQEFIYEGDEITANPKPSPSPAPVP
ncbi:MAG: LCP family protein [Christensenellales bacterium]|jgi:LCP family protein required for cell wall assembly